MILLHLHHHLHHHLQMEDMFQHQHNQRSLGGWGQVNLLLLVQLEQDPKNHRQNHHLLNLVFHAARVLDQDL